MNYPTPDQLRAFAREPMPFEALHECEEEIHGDMTIRYTKNYGEPDDGAFPGEAEVVFEYAPAYINAEVEAGEYERVTDEYQFEKVWDDALDTEVNDDYLCAIGHMVRDGEMVQFEAFWLLDEVTFKSPAVVR